MDLRSEDPTDDGSARVRALAAAGAWAAVAALAAIDLAADLGEGTTVRHALIEGGLVLRGATGLFLVLRRLAALRRSERELRAAHDQLAQQLHHTRQESERWRAETRELLAGLSAAIDRQFARWGLSAAEREVALLLLKGLSHREVAQARAVSEATVRQQARALYKKAGVEGRHELAAFFLEDLMAPRAAGGAATSAPAS